MKKQLFKYGVVIAMLFGSMQFVDAQIHYIPRVSCKHFLTQQAAQAYFNYWVRGIGKPKSERRRNGRNLDRDNDGYACDCNQGSAFYGTKRCNKSKRK